MINIFDWFVTSSQNPENISLFLKSAATFAVLFGVDSTIVANLQSSIPSLVVGLGMVISAVTAIYGLIRKLQFGRWSAPK